MEGKGRGSNPNSQKNLTKGMFKKGHKPPPTSGRPKGSISLKDRLAHFMEREVEGKDFDGTTQKMAIADNVVLALLARAIMGDVPAIKEIFDRYYGKETQPIDLMTQEKEETLISMEERIKKYVKP